MKKNKVNEYDTLGMFMIEPHSTSTCNYWDLDIARGTCIFCEMHGLKESRKLKHTELKLIMGNIHILPMIRIGDYKLVLISDAYF